MSISSVRPTACMIDLETLGLEPGSLILSASAVFFDLTSPTFEPHNIITCYFDIVQTPGTIDKKTLKWHLDNTPPGVLIANFTGRGQFVSWLSELYVAYQKEKDCTVWSKGVDFDIVHLEHWYSIIGRAIPWHYRQRMCYRTVRKLAERSSALDFRVRDIEARLKGEKHTAEGDALNQAECLHQIMAIYDLQRKLLA